MIINLADDTDQVERVLNHLGVVHNILDFTGAVPKQLEGVVMARELDSDHGIEIRALSRYVKFCGEISRSRLGDAPIRSFNVLGMPIFWLTDLSEKHDSRHWGQSLFFLMQLLEEQPELLEKDKQLVIVLPGRYYMVEDTLQRFFFGRVATRLVFEYTESKQAYGFASLLSATFLGLLRGIRLKLRLKDIDDGVSEAKNICIAPLGANGEPTGSDLKQVFELSQTRHRTGYFPFLTSFNFIKRNPNEYVADLGKSFPSIGQLIRLGAEIVIVYLTILRFRSQRLMRINGVTVSDSLLVHELLAGLKRFIYYVNGLWLGNYLQLEVGTKAPRKVFYSDEFYISGRIITLALHRDRSKAVGYGVQHGLLLKNHTVYVFSDLEIQPDQHGFEGVPVPDFFVVWGQYFKDLFLSTHSLSPERILIGGNAKYIGHVSKEKLINRSSPLRILWCTTLKNHFVSEYQVLEEVLIRRKDYSLTFRLHPVGHMSGDWVLNNIADHIKNRSQISHEENILVDIENHDLVVSTVFSSVFLDSLLVGTPVCRIITRSALADFSHFKIRNMFDIRSGAEFERILKGVLEPEAKISEKLGGGDIREFCELDNLSGWRSILNSRQY